MRQTTLCLLIKKDKILLAMKKRGFGVGKWNGIGGKLDFGKGDKNIIGIAVRETEEEIGVRIKDLKRVAVLSFYFPYNRDWNQDAHVFLVKDWEGEPTETKEMMPRWFKMKKIPFKKMWDDDKFWLPQILEGKKMKAKFIFSEGEKISGKNIVIMRNL